MDGIIAVSIPIALFVAVALIAKWLSDNRVRRELARANIPAETIESIMQNPVQDPRASLKWGIVTVAIGMALAIIHLASLDADDPMAFSLVFLLGGGGLLLFYQLDSRHNGVR